MAASLYDVDFKPFFLPYEDWSELSRIYRFILRLGISLCIKLIIM